MVKKMREKNEQPRRGGSSDPPRHTDSRRVFRPAFAILNQGGSKDPPLQTIEVLSGGRRRRQDRQATGLLA
jgi:hypothetical protein